MWSVEILRYSRVSLSIICCVPADAEEISSSLGVRPSEVSESRTKMGRAGCEIVERTHHIWELHSPMPPEGGDAAARLWALVDIIEPFGDRLAALDPKWHRWIDIIYHVTPDNPSGMTPGFDWFRLPAPTIKLLAQWNLEVSYEVFWFNHPEWQPPRRSWWSRMRRRSRKAV